MQSLKNGTLKLLILDQKLDNPLPDSQIAFPESIKNYIKNIFISLNIQESFISLKSDLPILKRTILKDRAVEYMVLNQGINKFIEQHLYPFISGLQNTPPETPLFQKLEKAFSVDREQLLNIALRAYCRYAFRVVYQWKYSLRTVPEIYYQIPKDPNITPVNFDDEQRWFQTWTGTPAPSFSKNTFDYLKALEPAINLDFGSFAPHPKELVDIAIEEVKALQKIEIREMGEARYSFFIYTTFNRIFTKKITELLFHKFNLQTPFDPAEVQGAENEKIYDWYKRMTKNDTPPFNLTVLKAVHFTAGEVQKITIKNPRFSFSKIADLSLKIIQKYTLAVKFEKEKYFSNILTLKLEAQIAIRIDLHTPFNIKEIKDPQSKEIYDWYKKFSTEDPPFNIVVLKQTFEAIQDTEMYYDDVTGFTFDDLNRYVKFVIYKVRMSSRASLEDPNAENNF